MTTFQTWLMTTTTIATTKPRMTTEKLIGKMLILELKILPKIIPKHPRQMRVNLAPNHTHLPTSLVTLQQSLPQETYNTHTVLQAKADSNIQNLWHQRLGHPNNRRLRDMANNPLYLSRGFASLTSKQPDMRQMRDACMLGKSHKITSHKLIDKDTSKKGQTWSIDLTGAKDTPAIGNAAIIGVVIIEHTNRFSCAYTIRNNDEDSILEVLRQWNDNYLALAKSWHRDDRTLVHYLHSDNLEMKYPKVQKILTSIG